MARASGTEANAHFGYAERFLVFDVGDDEECRLLEERETAGHCTGTEDDAGTGGDRRALRRTVGVIADCTAVIASKIGPCARRDLDAVGVLALEHPGPGLEGAEALVAGLNRSRLVRERRQGRQKERSR